MMKFILAVLVLIASFSVNAIDYSAEQTKPCSHDENLTCDLNDQPLSGLLVSYNDAGLRIESNFKDGKKQGIQRGYHKNGILSSEMNFKEGKKDGLSKGYDMDGNLIYEETFKDGKSEGFLKNYYKTGQLRLDTNTKGNKRISQRIYSKEGDLLYETKLDTESEMK